MRGLRSTIALAVVLAGLGAYIYFVTSKQDTDSSTTKLEKVFPGLATDKINELTVKSESGDTTTLKKEGDKWQMTSPLQTHGSEADVVAITGALGQLEVSRVVDENPSGLGDYGLDKPQIEVDYKTSDGKSGKVLVGVKNATGSSLYAKRNEDKRVFLIAQYQEASLNKSTFDMRDKSIMSLETDKADGAQVVADGKTIQFAKASGSEWKLVKPIAGRADFSAVEGLLSKVATAQMKSVATDTATPADLKMYGLDKPAVSVTVNMGSAHGGFEIGGKAAADTVYARDASKPVVVTVDKTLVDDLKKTVDDYRPKNIFESRAFNIDHIEITRGSQKLVLDRVKAKTENDADTWHRTSPNPGDADKDKVSKTLADLADFNVTSFVDSTAKTGLDQPAMVVDVKFDDNKKTEKVTFGKSGNDIFAARPDEPGAAKIDAGKYNDALKELDELSK